MFLSQVETQGIGPSVVSSWVALVVQASPEVAEVSQGTCSAVVLKRCARVTEAFCFLLWSKADLWMLGSWASSTDMLLVFLSSSDTGGQAGILQLPVSGEGEHRNHAKAIGDHTARSAVALPSPAAFSASDPLNLLHFVGFHLSVAFHFLLSWL